MKNKRHPVPALRRHRRAALMEMLLMVLLSTLIAVIVMRRMGPVYEIREDRLMQEAPVHIIPLETAAVFEPSDAAEVWVRYPVPLEDELQKHIARLCEGTAVSPCVVMALIDVETGGTFDAGAIGDNGKSVGLMQIYAGWHRERMERLGVTDLMDPYQNVAVGIDLLDELCGQGRGLDWALMAYNGGTAFADRMESKGLVSEYARNVIRLSECMLESAQVMT